MKTTDYQAEEKFFRDVRSKELENLDLLIKQRNIVYIHGPQGVGKTVCVQHLLKEYQDNKIIICIQKTDDKPRKIAEKILSATNDIISKEGEDPISPKYSNIEEMINLIDKNNVSGKFIVIDNVELLEDGPAYKLVLERLSNLAKNDELNFHLILIGQSKTIPNGLPKDLVRSYYIGGLNSYDQVNIYIQKSFRELEANLVNHILNKTGGIPLFIDFALDHLRSIDNAQHQFSEEDISDLINSASRNNFFQEKYNALGKYAQAALRVLSLYTNPIPTNIFSSIFPDILIDSSFVNLRENKIVSWSDHVDVIPIIRDFVIEISRKHVNQDKEFYVLGGKASEIAKDYISSINFYMLAEKWKTVIDSISTNIKYFINNNYSDKVIDILENAVKSFESNNITDHLQIHEIRGDLLMHSFSDDRRKNALTEFELAKKGNLSKTEKLRIYRKIARSHAFRGETLAYKTVIDNGMELLQSTQDTEIDPVEQAFMMVEYARYICMFETNNYRRAYNLCQNAINILEEHPYAHEVRALALHFKGMAACYINDPDIEASHETLRKADQEWEYAQNKFAQPHTKHMRGFEVRDRDFRRSKMYLIEAIELSKKLGNISSLVSAVVMLIDILKERGDIVSANIYLKDYEKYLTSSKPDPSARPDPSVKPDRNYITSLIMKGNASYEDSKWEEAEKYYKDALGEIENQRKEVLEKNLLKDLFLAASSSLIEMYLVIGKLEDAQRITTKTIRMYDLFKEDENPKNLALFSQEAEIAARKNTANQMGKIISRSKRAYRIARNQEEKYTVALLSYSLAKVYLVIGNETKAFEFLDEAIEIFDQQEENEYLGKSQLLIAARQIWSGRNRLSQEEIIKAEVTIGNAYENFKISNSSIGIARCRYMQAIVRLLVLDIAQSKELLDEAMETFKEHQLRYELALCKSFLAIIHAHPYLELHIEHLLP